jgi:hypothetical protein
MREPAARAPCTEALTRESRLIGVYMANSAAMKDVNSPVVSRPLLMALLP